MKRVFAVLLIAFVLLIGGTSHPPASSPVTGSLPHRESSEKEEVKREPPRVLVLVDSITPHLSQHVREYCARHGIRVVDVVSPVIARMFARQGHSVPSHLLAPTAESADQWLKFIDIESDAQVHCMYESEFSASTAHLLSTILGIEPVTTQSRDFLNRFSVQERLDKAGIPTLRHSLANHWEDVKWAANAIWLQQDRPQCVLKACNAKLHDRAFFCSTIAQARAACESLQAHPSDSKPDVIMIQDYAEGPEYVVDSVSLKGEHKTIAVFKGQFVSPLLCQYSDLVLDDDSVLREVISFCHQAIDAQGFTDGPSHCTVRQTKEGLRLVSFHPRWNAHDTVHLLRACTGDDIITASLDAAFFPDRYQARPSYAERLRRRTSRRVGRLVHLLSSRTGKITGLQQVERLKELSSVQSLRLFYDVHDQLPVSVDQHSSSGYVVLIGDKEEDVRRDTEAVLSLQDDLFVLDSPAIASTTSSSSSSAAATISAHKASLREELAEREKRLRRVLAKSALTTLALYGGSLLFSLAAPLLSPLLPVR